MMGPMEGAAAEAPWSRAHSLPRTRETRDTASLLLSKTLPWSSVSTCFKLSLSSAHVTSYWSHLINRDIELETDPDKRCWGVSIVPRQTNTSTEYFLQGWRPIAQALSLRPGDQAHFSLVSPARLQLRISHLPPQGTDPSSPSQPPRTEITATHTGHSSGDSSRPKRRRCELECSSDLAEAESITASPSQKSSHPRLQDGLQGRLKDGSQGGLQNVPQPGHEIDAPGTVPASSHAHSAPTQSWPSLPRPLTPPTGGRASKARRVFSNDAGSRDPLGDPLVCSLAAAADDCLTAFEARAVREVHARLQAKTAMSGRAGARMIMCARDLSLYMSYLSQWH